MCIANLSTQVGVAKLAKSELKKNKTGRTQRRNCQKRTESGNYQLVIKLPVVGFE